MAIFRLVLFIILVVVFAYFGVANALVHLISYFKFYRPLSKKLLKHGVFTDPAYANTVKGRLWGNIIVLLIALAATIYGTLGTFADSHGVSVAAAVIAFLFGLLLYAKKLRYELWNVQQFAKQYHDYLDKEKFTAFLRREYDIPLAKLSDDRFVLQWKRKK